MSLLALIQALRQSRGFQHKQDLLPVLEGLRCQQGGTPADAEPSATERSAGVGDDCAALPDGRGGYLLFAIEGLVADFVQRLPWFAGYCGVMVNVSDICAMGGRPLAVVDALWSRGKEPAQELLAGLATAARRYGVPLIGGHSNCRSDSEQLAVAVLGRAERLLTSFAAQPGDALIAAIDLRGAYEDPYPYWNASTRAPEARLREDLEVLPRLAESGLCDAAKDISMAGVLGTTLMLLDSSRTGAVLWLEDIPRPSGTDTEAALLRWLMAFPSYGFVLSVRPAHVDAVLTAFRSRDLSARVFGQVTPRREVLIRRADEQALLWDLAAKPFILPATAAPDPVPAPAVAATPV